MRHSLMSSSIVQMYVVGGPVNIIIQPWQVAKKDKVYVYSSAAVQTVLVYNY